MKYLKLLWTIIKTGLADFFAELFPLAKAIVIAALKDYASTVVKDLSVSDLKSEDKRKVAYLRIKEEAKKKGIEVKDSLINLMIELAVQKLKA